MQQTLLVAGSPELHTSFAGRCAHGAREVGPEATALAVAECLVGGKTVARAAVEAALASFVEERGSDPVERVRRALLAADAAIRTGDRPAPRCAVAVSFVLEDRAFVGSAGPVRIYLMRERTILHKVDETHLPLGGEPGVSPVVSVLEQPWVLEQSDRLLLWTSPAYEVIEDVLLPNLMANRPPDRCIESMLKLARYRGLDDDHAVLVAAWQDPALATIADGMAFDMDSVTAEALASRDAFPSPLLDEDTASGTPPPARPKGPARSDEPSAPSRISSILPLVWGAVAIGALLALLAGAALVMSSS